MEIHGEIRYTRLDTSQTVQLATNLQPVPASLRLAGLMASCIADTATPVEIAEFRQLWQERVRSILLDHGDDPEVFVITKA